MDDSLPTDLNGDIDIIQTYVDPCQSPVDYHHSALAYWTERKGAVWAPTWADVSLMDFDTKAIPMTSVTDITPEPLSSIYRFWGTKLTEIYGADYSGKSPTEIPPKSLGLSNKGGCGRLVNEKAPHLELKEFKTERGRLGRSVILRLPLSDDGESVNHGINIYYFEPAQDNQPLADYFSKMFAKLAGD